LSLKNSTFEVNFLGIDIHAIHSPWGQTIAIQARPDCAFKPSTQFRLLGYRNSGFPLRCCDLVANSSTSLAKSASDLVRRSALIDDDDVNFPGADILQ